MAGWGGLETLRQLGSSAARTAVVVLSMHSTQEYVGPALQAGARGYVVKGSGLEHLVTAMRTVIAGRRFVDASVAPLLSPVRDGDALGALTTREREVLQLVAEGLTSRDIGRRLCIALKTVDTHRTSLMRKLDLHNSAAVTRFALRHGIIDSK